MGDMSKPYGMIREATRKLELEALRISDPSHDERANLQAQLNALRSTGHDSHDMKYQSSEALKQPLNLPNMDIQDIIIRMKDKPNGYEEFHCEEMSLPPVNVPTAYQDLKKRSPDVRDQYIQTQPQIVKKVDIRDEFVQTQPQIAKKVDIRDQFVQTQPQSAKKVDNRDQFVQTKPVIAKKIDIRDQEVQTKPQIFDSAKVSRKIALMYFYLSPLQIAEKSR